MSASRGRRWRRTRIATRAASIAGTRSSGFTGFTVISSERRDPNRRWNAPSGITTNSSCDIPKTEPFFSLTPSTVKCVPLTWMTLSTGLRPLNSLSAVSQPMSATLRPASTSVRLGSRPCSAV